MQEMLEEGEIDLLTSAQKTPEREEKFDFSTEPIGTSATLLTIKSGSTKFIAGDYSTYQNMKVGMIENSTRNQSFLKFANAHAFSYSPLIFSSVSELQKALSDETVDAIVTSDLRLIENEWILEKFDSSDFYALVKKGNTDLLSKINQAIEIMDNNNLGWRNELFTKYYNPVSGDEIAYTAQEREYIASLAKSGKTLKAIVNPDRAPYSYFENNEAKGIMVDIFKEIAKRANVKYEIIQPTDRQNYFELANNSNIDIRIDTNFNYYYAEIDGYKLTNPYMKTSLSLITRKNNYGEIKKIGVITNSDSLRNFKDTLLSTKELVYYSTSKECVDAVKKNEVDGTYLYTYTAQEYIQTDVENDLSARLVQDRVMSFSIAVSKDASPLLLSVLNKAASSINEDFLQETVWDYTIKENSNTSLVAFVYDNPFTVVLMTFLLLFIIAGMALFLEKNKSTNKLRLESAETEKALKKAEIASKAKSDFFSNMSHDMRTPMNGIIGLTNLLLDNKDLSIEERKDILAIDESAKYLLSLINQTLDMSKIESNKRVLQLEKLDGKALIDNIIKEVTPLSNEKKITIHLKPINVSNDSIIADKLCIQQLFINVISNAIKFTPINGKIIIEVESLERKENRTYLRISVEDNGIGMSEEFLPHIFESFSQEKTISNSQTTGTGLGMSIVKKLIDLMGGKIEVTSKPNIGTKVTAFLDFELAIDSPSILDNEEEKNYSFVGKKILLCEDHPLNMQIAKRLLEKKGATVFWAKNGKIGLDKFQESKQGFYDAILMDIRMPIMDGLEASKSIRGLEREDAKKIPIIAMTANAFEDDIERTKEVGMNAHLAKPVDVNELYQTLDQFIGDKS